MSLFEMAAVYVESIAIRHPFVDGNKRVAATCALTFLYLNGYALNESYDEEFADQILALLGHEISKSEPGSLF